MPIGDYKKNKPLDVQSVSGTPTVSKAQPLILVDGDDSTTGTGDIVIDFANISDAQDIAVYDQNDNLLDYEIEELDTNNNTAVLWAYHSWVRDGTTQAKIAYGDNSANTDRQNVTGTWNNAGQNAEAVYHWDELSGQTIDSTNNDVDSTSTTGTQFDVSGDLNGARRADGSDDEVEFGDGSGNLPSNIPSGSEARTLVNYFEWENDTGSQFTHLFNWGSSDTNNGWGHIIEQNNSDLILFRFGGSSDQVLTSISQGTKYHTVATFDGTDTSTGYVDGVLENQDNSASGVDTKSSGFLMRAFGALDDDGLFNSKYFNGVLDDTRIYSDEKSDAWQQADYDATPKAGQVFFSQQAAQGGGGGTSFSETVTETTTMQDSITTSLNQANNFTESLTETTTMQDNVDKATPVYLFEDVSVNRLGEDNFYPSSKLGWETSQYFNIDESNQIDESGTLANTESATGGSDGNINIEQFLIDVDLKKPGIVTTVGFYSAETGPFEIKIKNSYGRVVASRRVSRTGGEFKEHSFSESDYLNLREKNLYTVNINGDLENSFTRMTGGTKSFNGSLFTIEQNNRFFSDGSYPYNPTQNGGTVIGFTEIEPEKTDNNTLNVDVEQADADGVSQVSEIRELQGEGLRYGDTVRTQVLFSDFGPDSNVAWRLLDDKGNTVIEVLFKSDQLDTESILFNGSTTGAANVDSNTVYDVTATYRSDGTADYDINGNTGNETLVTDSEPPTVDRIQITANSDPQGFNGDYASQQQIYFDEMTYATGSQETLNNAGKQLLENTTVVDDEILAIQKAIEETTTLTETDTYDVSITQQDTTTLTEDFNKTAAKNVSETVSMLDGDFRDVTLVFQDNTSLTDTVDTPALKSISLDETTTLQDRESKETTKPLQDNTTLTDNTTKKLSLAALTETVSLDDTTEFARTLLLADTITTSDEVSISGDTTIVLTDTLTTTDKVLKDIDLDVIADIATVQDQTNFNVAAVLNETFNADDQTLKSLERSLSEAVTVSDTVDAFEEFFNDVGVNVDIVKETSIETMIDEAVDIEVGDERDE